MRRSVDVLAIAGFLAFTVGLIIFLSAAFISATLIAFVFTALVRKTVLDHALRRHARTDVGDEQSR
jgi:hypothetical protein